MQQPRTLSAPALDAPETQIERVRQFLAWTMAGAFGFSIFHGIAYLIMRDPGVGLGGVIVFAYGCALLLARSQVRRGQTVAAVMTICGGLLAMIPAHVLALPDLYPALAVVPLLVVTVALPYLPARTMRGLAIACLVATVVVPLFGRTIRLLPAPPEVFTNVLGILSVPSAVGLVLLLLWQFSTRLQDTLALTRSANEALQQTQAELETSLGERTATLERVQALVEDQARLLAENDQQRQAIAELSVPVLPVSASTLVMPLVGAMDTTRLQQMQERALRAIVEAHARSMVLDISGVPVVDTQVAHGLVGLVQAARLVGCEIVLVGIRPEVAQTIVGLGVQLGGMRTFGDLQAALARTEAPRTAAAA